MKKLILSTLVLFTLSSVSYAFVTPEEVRSETYMKDEGYSSALIQVVQQESGEYNPKPTNRFQRFGFKFWNMIDPAAPKARDDIRHDIKTYPHYSDL